MFRESFEMVTDRIKDSHSVAIVGAGMFGRELAAALIDNKITPDYFLDNNEKIQGLMIYGIPVIKPSNISNECLYVISVMDGYLRFCLREQLLGLGVAPNRICCYYPCRCGDYHKELLEEGFKEEDSKFFEERLHYRMDWENPTTYNQILNWEKFNIHDEYRTRLVDKVLAKEWITEKLGAQYVTRTYGCWDDPTKIDFNVLPERFVLKANNGSGRNIIVEDKEKLDRNETRRKLKYWLQSNFYYDGFEEQYRNIKPMILAEEYLDGVGTISYDYQIYCFHGEPEYIRCIKESHRPNCVAAFYDKEWNIQPFNYGYPLDIFPVPRPAGFESVLEMTRMLSKGFKHVRVDWYQLPNGKYMFSEITISPWAGLMPFEPKKYDEIFGKLIREG